ncbi:MAG: hypothetical protein GWP12_03605, partial [Nitrospirae bacterium]|nr:hypothetical protein [Nitrospirota bacterium]
LHAPIVLLTIAIIIGLAYPLSFRPLLAGFLSHSLLDIFLFDNSQGTIRNIINLIVTNNTAAAWINHSVTTKVAAKGIMLLYPFSQKMYYLLLTETDLSCDNGTYAVQCCSCLVSDKEINLEFHLF